MLSHELKLNYFVPFFSFFFIFFYFLIFFTDFVFVKSPAVVGVSADLSVSFETAFSITITAEPTFFLMLSEIVGFVFTVASHRKS